MSYPDRARRSMAEWMASLSTAETARIERLVAEYVAVIIATIEEDWGAPLGHRRALVLGLADLLACLLAEHDGVDLGTTR